MPHTMTDENTGTMYELTGDTLQEIADQAKALTDNGCALSGNKVCKDNGELRSRGARNAACSACLNDCNLDKTEGQCVPVTSAKNTLSQLDGPPTT